jgi:hypothetical protein
MSWVKPWHWLAGLYCSRGSGVCFAGYVEHGEARLTISRGLRDVDLVLPANEG